MTIPISAAIFDGMDEETRQKLATAHALRVAHGHNVEPLEELELTAE